jgi:hypothetical protein
VSRSGLCGAAISGLRTPQHAISRCWRRYGHGVSVSSGGWGAAAPCFAAAIASLGLGIACAAPHAAPETVDRVRAAGEGEPPRTAEPSPRETAAHQATAQLSTTTASGSSASTPPADPQQLAEPVPPLFDAAGNPLAQTDERPRVDSASFRRRLELLVRAIREDDGQLALPAFFPVVAYQQVKEIAKPEDDWQRRLVAAFLRNVHEYHQRLGQAASSAELVGIELDNARVKFMDPHREGNKVGYFRVTRAALRLRTSEGERTLDITSMISWRGEWYVVHLHGYK